ncbi:acyl-CoA N-acyltransferase [Mycena epipterygia]|nr:acyl-CoA N-acyltransferase [Mycena epipterygia]
MILAESLASMSGRIMLVPPSELDDASMAALRCHPETRRHISFFPEHYTPEEARERRIARAADTALVDFSIYAVTPEFPAKFVGATGIFHIDESFKACEAGITICPDSFRGGFATEALHRVLTYAFEERKLHRVAFQTSTDNDRMRGWLERAGATLEGTLRDGWADGGGGYTDVSLYSILERDWAQTVKAKLEERINRVVSG